MKKERELRDKTIQEEDEKFSNPVFFLLSHFPVSFFTLSLSSSVTDKSQAVLTQTLFIYKIVSLPLAPARLAHAVANKDFFIYFGTLQFSIFNESNF